MHTRYLQNHTYVVLCIAVLQCVLTEANILVRTFVMELVIQWYTDGVQANRIDILSLRGVSE